MSTINENIKQIRKKTGLTQKALAEKIGVSQMTMNRYENTAKNIPNEMILKIAEIFGVTSGEIYGENEDLEQEVNKKNEINALDLARKELFQMICDSEIENGKLQELNMQMEEAIADLKEENEKLRSKNTSLMENMVELQKNIIILNEKINNMLESKLDKTSD